MYKYTVIEQDLYKKSLKKLSKTYRNIDLDIKDFLASINTKYDKSKLVKVTEKEVDEFIAKQIENN